MSSEHSNAMLDQSNSTDTAPITTALKPSSTKQDAKEPMYSEMIPEDLLFALTEVNDFLKAREEGPLAPVKTLKTPKEMRVVGAMEAQLKKVTGNLIELSVQQIVECDQGCRGGLMTYAFDYIYDVGGIQSRKSYPRPAGECDFDEDGVVGRVKDYVVLEENHNSLQDAVAKIGPVAVGINVSYSLYSLSSGIYHCSPIEKVLGRHAVLVVGYGEDYGHKYWLIKNSWGTSWGMSGYGKLARSQNNNCGIYDYASYPIMSGADNTHLSLVIIIASFGLHFLPSLK